MYQLYSCSMLRILKTACKVLGIDPDTVNADVFFVRSDEIRELNRRTRNTDKPTDVLSFPMLEVTKPTIPTPELYPLDINPDTNKLELGDIVICKEYAELGINYLCVHGFLHLLGWVHETDADNAKMTEMTEFILETSLKNQKQKGYGKQSGVRNE